MSDNTPLSGSAGPHKGFRKGLGAIFSGTDSSAAIKSNISKAGHSIKKSLFQHKGAPTAGCSPGVREFGSDGYEKFNIDGDAIFITKRSDDVFSDDEFVDAGLGSYVGRRSAPAPSRSSEEVEIRTSQGSSFYPDLGTSPAPKTFSGIGRQTAPAASVASSVSSASSVHKTAVPRFLDNISRQPAVSRPTKAIDWSDDDDSEEEGVVIMKGGDAVAEPEIQVPIVEEAVEVEVPSDAPSIDMPVEAPVEPEPVEIPQPVPDVASKEEISSVEEPAEPVEIDVVEEAVRIPEVEAVEETIEEAPVVEEAVEVPEAEAVPVVEEPAVVSRTEPQRIEVPPMQPIEGLYTEGNAQPDVATSISETAVDVASASVETSDVVDAVQVRPEPVPAPEPADLSAYGIKELSDPVVSRPRPKYRTYRFNGGRLCDSDSVEGKKEGPQRPLD